MVFIYERDVYFIYIEISYLIIKNCKYERLIVDMEVYLKLIIPCPVLFIIFNVSNTIFYLNYISLIIFVKTSIPTFIDDDLVSS